MITTTTDTVWPSDVSLTHWQEVGLKVACHFRLKLFTLNQNLVLKTVGHLTSHDVKSLQAALVRKYQTASFFNEIEPHLVNIGSEEYFIIKEPEEI